MARPGPRPAGPRRGLAGAAPATGPAGQPRPRRHGAGHPGARVRGPLAGHPAGAGRRPRRRRRLPLHLPMSQTLIAALGFLGGVVAALVDGHRAVGLAALVLGLTLGPAAASVGGLPAAAVVIVAGLAAALLPPPLRPRAERMGKVA